MESKLWWSKKYSLSNSWCLVRLLLLDEEGGGDCRWLFSRSPATWKIIEEDETLEFVCGKWSEDRARFDSNEPTIILVERTLMQMSEVEEEE